MGCSGQHTGDSVMARMQFTRSRYEALVKRYDQAVANNEEQFVFEGHDLLTDYCKYLLQYLADQFDIKADTTA